MMVIKYNKNIYIINQHDKQDNIILYFLKQFILNLSQVRAMIGVQDYAIISEHRFKQVQSTGLLRDLLKSGLCRDLLGAPVYTGISEHRFMQGSLRRGLCMDLLSTQVYAGISSEHRFIIMQGSLQSTDLYMDLLRSKV